VNIYRNLGDRVGTLEARALAEQLVTWHDAMVKHVRLAERRRSDACGDGCPHDDAVVLWSDALAVFGEEANQLVFLRAHGRVVAPTRRRASAEARA
jgi:hypothetical protein